MIHEFFVVTETSVYLVTDKKDENGTPIVKKIVLKGQSKIPVGGRLKNGNLVGITKERILLYEGEMRNGRWQRPEEVNTAFWGGGTSQIIALFLKKEEAMKCFNSENLEAWDRRWKKQTEETLKSIGNNHPVFVLSEEIK
jgi:hypothetical protein